MTSLNRLSMVTAESEYSYLKYPLLVFNCSTTLLALVILFSYGSNAWFSYQSVEIVNGTTLQNEAFGSLSFHLLESGSLGLWSLCIDFPTTSQTKCHLWVDRPRPHHFNTIIALLSCALFLSNLILFPSWIVFVLLCYNRANRYLRHIVLFSWVLSLLSLVVVVLLISSLIFAVLTRFYTPGEFHLDNQQLNFYPSFGFFFAIFATVLALVCFLSISVTVVWRKVIAIDLMRAEKDLLRQLSDDTYRPDRNRVMRIPRTTNSLQDDDDAEAPPPYNGYH